ncbi:MULTISPECIES: acyltransferase family protein [Pseudomonas]|uniref:acyltransferase family protein n=1 Tax=Pseudomonas TaxID=286 RepID=UPI0025795A49|nr:MULTISPECIES: acyltransferase [Pseudomonas]
MINPTPPPTRLYTLDALRGIAALCVVFWHWQHFFYVGDNPAGYVISNQPFFQLFAPLYHYGGLAVQLFFSISGFVFFWLFSTGIERRTISARRFAVDRFSRLYPLHIATFVLVATLQWIYVAVHSTYFVYQANDGYHALLNILLIPAWGFEKGWSFNAPIWSVSVEMLLYLSFFLMCLIGRFKYPLAIAACALGWYLYPEQYKLGSGVLCFYIGGITYGVFDAARRQMSSGNACVTMTLLCLATWVYIATSGEVNANAVMCLCFPTTIAALAAMGHHWPNVLRSSAVLGDISYSSYLIHFPLQIVFALITDGLGFERSVFYQGWTMTAFFVVLIPLSLLCHRHLERPAQRYLRSLGRHTI